VCPRVDIGCRSRRTTLEVQRSRSPLANGACGREPKLRETLRKGVFRGDSKASTTGTAVAKPRSRDKPEPGVRKDVAGQRFSLDGRHSRSFVRFVRSRERIGGDLGGSRHDP
jgi:hypothetical protein